MHSRSEEAGEVFLERVALGRFLKVSAIDGASGVEVSVSGPVAAAASLEALAMRKLRARLATA